MSYFKSDFTQHTPLFRIATLVMVLFAFTACESDPEPPVSFENEFLVSTEEASKFTKEEMQQLAIFTGFGDYADLINTGITIHRITYQTPYKGNDVFASGLLVIPDNVGENSPLLSVQHGTIFSNDDAPSALVDQIGISGLELFSSVGFISVIPDFLGYGESREILHPYYQFDETQQSIRDLILAAQEYLRNQSINYDRRLFLTGYSEGGYATIAALKGLEQNPIQDLPLVAVAAGAGGYDINDVMDQILDSETYPVPAYLAFITYSHYITNDLTFPLTDYFNEPYASRIPDLFDGSLTQGQINNQLTNELDELFNESLLQGIRENENHPLRLAFSENSVANFGPTTPLRLYHSKNDEVVPFTNSVLSAEQMSQQGADDVTFIEIGGDSHGSALLPMFDDVIIWFLSLK